MAVKAATAVPVGILAVAWVAVAHGQAPPSSPGPNIALGKPYTLSPAPNYAYCTDPDDATQLTDGKTVDGYFWVQPGCVGWSGVAHADITIDLGTDQPIRGCSYSTAAGVAQVSWPSLIYLLVSSDGKTWYGGSDLISLSAKSGLPPAEGYTVHRFVTDELRLHGRYFRLLVAPSGSYTFCDEIEVYQGGPELMQADLGQPVGDPSGIIAKERVTAGVRRRLIRDIEALRNEAKEPGVPEATRAWALQEADRLVAEANAPLGPFDARWRAAHPLAPLHARIYAARRRVRRESGAPRFAVWQKCRWDMLDPMELPPKDARPPQLSVAMMQDEYRSEAINISNMGETDLDLDVFMDGLPGQPAPRFLTVHQVEWIETQAGIVVADALPVAPESEQKGWEIRVPAGMTRQVWLTFHSADLAAGTYDTALSMHAAAANGGKGADADLPLKLRVYPLRMPEKLTCTLGMWDYTSPPQYDLGPGNVDAAIRNMRGHYLDTPWAPGNCAWPQSFDAQGSIVGNLDWSAFDGWVADWADATSYAVFLAVGSSIGAVAMDDPRFPDCVGNWMHAWVRHLKELEIKPNQLLLLLVDEPSQKEQEEIIIRWARAIKAAEPEVVIWEDPVHEKPEAAASPAVFDVSDILCPNLAIFASGSEASRQFYADLQKRGKRLWFYQCSGPAKTHDPYYYHRLQEWYCFKYGAVGSGFWAYGDAAGAGTSWNELRAPRTSFTPVYLDANSVTDGKHFEAAREGLEDYEYLRMLRDRATDLEKRGRKGEAAKARELLQSVVDEVCGAGYDVRLINWSADKDRTAADRARVRVLEALTE